MALTLSYVRHLADSRNPNSLGNRLRSQRFQRFEALVAQIPRPMRVLDVGGTTTFWENRGWAGRDDVQITTVNLEAEEQRHRNVCPIVGDATNLSNFSAGSFDVVFSNSVIEHLFSFEAQRKMALEVDRVGKAYWIQTPNFWFPFEPHFHVPGWQWIPLRIRIALIQRWAFGWRGPCSDPVEARRAVEEVRLLSRRELASLFPKATLLEEKFGGLVKSWIAVAGFQESK